MLSNDSLVKAAASFKGDAKKRFETALKALINLAWTYKDALGKDFSFEANPQLYDEALRICRELSDGCSEDTKKRLIAIVEDAVSKSYDDAAWEYAEDANGEDILTRFDMAGSHLLALLNIWIAAAFANGFTKDYTRISVMRYLNNPFASGLFGAWGKDVLKWGRGYSKNIADQLAVIGQNAIIGGARYAEWMNEQENGATYYIRRRGSSYDCKTCDSLCGYPIPISEPFEVPHSRCVCWPEYHYDKMP